MRILPLLTLVLCASTALAQPNDASQIMVAPPQAPRVRPAEPGKQITQDLLDFVALVNGQGNQLFPAAFKWIYGARIGYFGANEWAREITLQRQGVTLKIENITIDAIEGETASATIDYSFNAPRGDAAMKAVLERGRSEKVQLHLGALAFGGEKIWQIVPPDAAPKATGLAQLDQIWATLSFHLAQKGPMNTGQDAADRSLMQLKQLALGVMQFVQDWDERYAFAPQYAEEALRPYLKNRDAFYIPGSRETYSFNANLSDQSLAQLNEVAQTVLFYEGQNETPNFRYDGKAAIGFADGHVALVSPEAARKLIWKP